MNTKTINAHVQTVPGYTPFQDDLYLTGTFNDWDPADPKYAFLRNADGSFSLTFQCSDDQLECKITRGSWSTSEGDHQGKSKVNRFLITKKEEIDFWFTIDSWLDVKTNDSMYNIREAIVLHPSFKIPQLNRKRKIWAHLPIDYRSSKKSYPVIYMMDGQNLFSGDETKTCWNVDQAMKQLIFKSSAGDHNHEMNPLQQYIIIGIEHGEEHRIDEYSAWKNESYGGGEAPQLLDFLCNTLKPYVDQHLRSLTDREHTIIMGSSMGGLFSLYAALERQDVFGNAGIFSPSLWFSPEILKYVRKKKIKLETRFLLMAGQKESESMTEDLLDLYDTLLEAGHDDHAIHYDLHTDGNHNEHFWAKEFEHALDWLSSNNHMHEKGIISNENFKFSLNPNRRELIVFIDDHVESPGLKVNDFCHDRVFHYTLFHGFNRISYADWQECLYTIKLMADQDLIFSRRVHLNQLPVEAEMVLVK